MAKMIDREGTYRGKPTDWGVSLSTGGYPQFVVAFSALEMYDFESAEWQDWEPYDMGITGFLILAGKDGEPSKNAQQVMKAFGWDGMSLQELNDADHSEAIVQFRVAEEEYEGKSRLKVQWVDEAEATPGSGTGTVKKLDEREVKQLDVKFKNLCKKLSGGKVKTVKPPVPPSAPPKAAVEQPEKVEDTSEPEVATPPPPKKAKATPPKKSAKKKEEKEYNLDLAWAEVCAETEGKCADEYRVEAWSQVRSLTVGDKDDAEITQAEWKSIIKDTIVDCTRD